MTNREKAISMAENHEENPSGLLCCFVQSEGKTIFYRQSLALFSGTVDELIEQTERNFKVITWLDVSNVNEINKRIEKVWEECAIKFTTVE